MPNNEPKTCADCGDVLDVWGACPHADAKDVAVMRAPVNCGKSLTQVLHEINGKSPAGSKEEAA